MTKPASVKIPKDLENLGLSVNFHNGLFCCIDTDGLELKSFPLLHQAYAYLRENFSIEVEVEEVIYED